jgi:hypothetical protein
MKFPSPLSNPLFREFWRGLTTPDFGVLKMAAVIFLVLLGALSVAAVNFRKQVEAGNVDWRVMTNDFCRSSVIAVNGAARETDPSALNLIFVGPSALRCWLPPSEEADALASSVAGSTVRLRVMSGNRQGYAITAALVDRFGADFNGWFVIGVGRQAIGCELTTEDLEYRRRQPRILCFDSEVLRSHAAYLGYPMDRATGWELWDHRAFHYQTKLGLDRPFKRKPYHPYMPATSISSDAWRESIRPLDASSLERHLTVLEQTVRNVREQGRARVALVETPWVDTFAPAMRTPEWRRDEDAYQQTMREWSQRNNVPWITAASRFEASVADFADVRHVGSPELRRKFLEAVVRELVVP